MFPSLVVIKPNHAISSFQFGVVYILRAARPNERALLRFTASDRAQTTAHCRGEVFITHLLTHHPHLYTYGSSSRSANNDEHIRPKNHVYSAYVQLAYMRHYAL